ncbi:MAG: hypothetical protein HQL70_01405 [Magnetococcales bacterium]|nr:hypothetical protein [Magnetococcales bacterium]
MVYGNDEFNVCPVGKEADEFHERILAGLMDSFLELEESYNDILNTAPGQRDQGQAEFLELYKKAQTGLDKIKKTEMSYDQKYFLAQEIREYMTDMELL